eukprot:evm.model.NODE_19184_length_12086_cov_51.707016.4
MPAPDAATKPVGDRAPSFLVWKCGDALLLALEEVLGEEDDDDDEGGGEPVRRVGARAAMVLAPAPSAEALAVVLAPWEGKSNLFPIFPFVRMDGRGGDWNNSRSLPVSYVLMRAWKGVFVCGSGYEYGM